MMPPLVTGIGFRSGMICTHLHFSSVASSELAGQLCQHLFKKSSLSPTLSSGPCLWLPPLASASPTRPHGRAVIFEASVPGTRAHTFVKHLTNMFQNRPGLMKTHPQDEKPTVRAWTASHSCGDWILWASSRTAICGLGDKQPHFQDTDPEALWLDLLGLRFVPFQWTMAPAPSQLGDSPFQLLVDLVTEADYVFPVFLAVGRIGGLILGQNQEEDNCYKEQGGQSRRFPP